MDKHELMKATSTRQILSEFKRQRMFIAEEYEDDIYPDSMIRLSRVVKGGEVLSFLYTKGELKRELMTRPHVPNKRESRGLRMLRKKTGKKRG